MSFPRGNRRGPSVQARARYENAAARKCPHCGFYLFVNNQQVHFPDQCPARGMQSAQPQRGAR